MPHDVTDRIGQGRAGRAPYQNHHKATPGQPAEGEEASLHPPPQMDEDNPSAQKQGRVQPSGRRRVSVAAGSHFQSAADSGQRLPPGGNGLVHTRERSRATAWGHEFPRETANVTCEIPTHRGYILRANRPGATSLRHIPQLGTICRKARSIARPQITMRR